MINLKKNLNIVRNICKNIFNKISITTKFHIVILTPDVNIDRRIIQICESLTNNFNVKCTIIAALHGEDGTCDDNIKIKRVYPKAFFRKIKDPWLPENFDICLSDFYWLHYQYLDSALKERADLYMACDLPILPAAVIAAKIKKIPIIYDSHELYPEQAVFDKQQKELLTKAEQIFIKHTDRVLTVNKSISKEMEARYRIQPPIVILNAIDTPENFNINKKYNYFRKTFNIKAEKKIILFQGGFSKNRNLLNLIKSGKYITDNIVIILMGFGEYGKLLKQTARSYGLLNKKVFFHSAVKQEILLKYSASADAGIIPYPAVDLNNYYCTPNKLFEFIQAGIPILGNSFPELQYFIEGYGIGITYNMESAKDIANGINRIFSMQPDIFIKNILKIRNKVNWKTEEEKIVKFMENYILYDGTEPAL